MTQLKRLPSTKHAAAVLLTLANVIAVNVGHDVIWVWPLERLRRHGVKNIGHILGGVREIRPQLV
jgi:hypothetical protein